MSIVVFEHSDLSPSGTLGKVLRNNGHRLDVRKLHHGADVPVDYDNVDGIVTCGGPQSANDDGLPWLAAELDFLEGAAARGLPVIGLCLGSQIVARALDGVVERMETIEFGWHPVELTKPGKTDIIHAGVGWSTMMFHHHRDYVARLPENAELLASTGHCPHQTWRVGERIYCFQYHGEITRQSVLDWIDDEPEVLDEAGITREEVIAQTDEYISDMIRVAERIFERLALLVVPVDRRIAGLHEDTRY